MTSENAGNIDRIRDALNQGNLEEAAAYLRTLPAADIAELIVHLPDPIGASALEGLSASDVSAVLEYLLPKGPDSLASVLTMPLDSLVPVLEKTSPGTSARLLRTFPDEQRQAVLERINDSELVRQLIAEEEETAGALTTTEFLALRVGMTVDQATTTIRRSPGLTQKFERLFVVDGEERLVGGLSFRDLLLANARTPLTKVMEEVPITVSSDTDQEECARLMERYHLEALPIVDEQRRLLGFVDLTDVLDVAEEEATEDMYQIVGLSGQESVASSVWVSFRRRLPWLSVNLLTVFAAASVVAVFEPTIARAAILAAFLPIVGGQAGNATIQTVTIIVRSIALGEVTGRNGTQVLIKETMLGLLQGTAFGLVVGLAGLLWTQDPRLAIALGVALALNMVAAGAGGVLIPLGLRRFGVDPALASGVFGTTTTDVLGFAFLLGLATVTLNAFGA